ncbi:MAG: YfbK domain-containing protein [Acidobacteriota bacterium]
MIEEIKLTAYVLGELDPAERAALEAELETSAEARRQLEEIRRAVGVLREAVAVAGPAALRSEQREAIERELRRTAAPRPAWKRLYVAAGLAAAAGLVVAVALTVSNRPTEPVRGVAMRKSQAEQHNPVSETADRSADASRAIRPGEDASVGSVRLAEQRKEQKLASPAAATDGLHRDTAGPVNFGTRRDLATSEIKPEINVAASPGVSGTVVDQTASAKSEIKKGINSTASPGVSGTVVDRTGSVIPGATVTVRDLKTGSAKTVLSDGAGNYQIPNLPPGEHELKVQLPGFKDNAQKFNVAPGRESRADAQLEVGELAETVTVQKQSGPRQSYSSARQIITRGQQRGTEGGIGGGVGPVAAPVPVARTSDESVIRKYDRPDQPFNTEEYDHLSDNPFIAVTQDPLSTFSIDVDTASYANVRRFLNSRQLPPKDAVRIEELINYFSYEYAQPRGEHPFATHVEVAEAPWNRDHRLVRIGIKGKDIDFSRRPASNIVFLLDVSGSMDQPNKLPLVKDAMKLLVEQLGENDRVAIVVYAGDSGVRLQSTRGHLKETILTALDRLRPGGSTNGGSGINLAYQMAAANFIPGGINRVILATDGDFNVGVTSQGELIRLIEEKARTGVSLSVLGFGMGNYKDSTLEKLADKGNGNYAYIDTINEGRKVLVEQLAGTLLTIAKDVKIQIEFNPARVASYRLLGYENRVLRHQDFNDDRKDAGDIGAGHTVTAFYEVVSAGGAADMPPVDPLKYQRRTARAVKDKASNTGELLTLKLRYKDLEGNKSKLIEIPVVDGDRSFRAASPDFRFAAAVASFGMLLRESPHKGDANFQNVLQMAESSLGADRSGYRSEFIELVRMAQGLKKGSE